MLSKGKGKGRGNGSGRAKGYASLKGKELLIEGSSDFHNKIRTIMLSPSFKGIPAYQEVPIQFFDSEEKSILFVDWFIPLFSLAIELQGEHHYRPINFSGSASVGDLNYRFLKQRTRDNLKANILLESGINYCAIPYYDKDKLNESYLVKIIKSVQEE